MQERVDNPVFEKAEGTWVLDGEKVDVLRNSDHKRESDFVGFACPQNDWMRRAGVLELAAVYREYNEHVKANHVAGQGEEQVDVRLEYVYKAHS